MHRRKTQSRTPKKKPRRTKRRGRRLHTVRPVVVSRERSPDANSDKIAALRDELAAAFASYTPEPSVADEHIADAVGPTFDALQKHRDPNARGHEFERLLQRLFRISGFDAERNPSIAHPRQTDLLARWGGQIFLLEAKWQGPPVDIDDLDSIHARMRRAPRGTIGCFFAMSTYTATAIERANRLRDAELGGHEIILFDASEVTALMKGWSLLRDSIDDKLKALRERGETVFLRDATKTRLQPLDIPFPSPSVQRAAANEEQPVPGRADSFVFGELPQEFDTWEQRKHGFELFGPTSVGTCEELRALLQLLHSKLRFVGCGGYSITELHNEKMWFGTSPGQLVDTLTDVARRHRVAERA